MTAMSLNGLDDKPVKEAHQNALAEAGGWYVSTLAIASLVHFFERKKKREWRIAA